MLGYVLLEGISHRKTYFSGGYIFQDNMSYGSFSGEHIFQDDMSYWSLCLMGGHAL